MKNGFRQSMAWLHTWTGLLVGWLLLLIFMAGTASYYREEISRWMRPELPRSKPSAKEKRVDFRCVKGCRNYAASVLGALI